MAQEQLDDLITDDLDGAQADDDGSTDSAEQRAARFGWKPQDEYKGKAEWTDAETFLQRVETDGPDARTALKNLERRYEKLEKTTDAIYAHQQRMVESAEQQGYERAMAEVNARLSSAVEEGDFDGVNKALADRDKLNGAGRTQEKDAYSPEDHAFANGWKAKNDWFGSDPVLSDAAARISNMEAEKGRSVQQQLEAAEKYVRETWPHKFRQAKTAPHMPGGGSSTRVDRRPAMGSYESLSAVGKTECDRYVKDVLTRGFSDEKKARAEWLNAAPHTAYPQLYIAEKG